jgi:two-component system chemotaxis response regulator CheB
VIGVILSGLLDDGAAGLGCVKELGGATVVQDPDDAMFAAMPRAAMAATVVDRITPADQIPSVLQEFVRERVAWSPPVPEPGPDQVERDPSDLALVSGEPSPLTCPACGGALWEAANGQVLRFVCQVGHAYSADSMLVEQGAAVELAMWSALRTLEERGELLARIAHRQRGSSRGRFEQRAAEAQERARQIREVLVAHGMHAGPVGDSEPPAGDSEPPAGDSEQTAGETR